MEPHDRSKLQKMHGPLRLLFWGAVLVVFDFQLAVVVSGGGGRAVDLLPDSVGGGLVAAGTIWLASRGIFEGVADGLVTMAATIFTFLFAGEVTTLVWPDEARLEAWGLGVLALASLVAVASLSFAMYTTVDALGLSALARRWRDAGILFAAWCVLPYALHLAAVRTDLQAGSPWIVVTWVLFGALSTGYLLYASYRTGTVARGKGGAVRTNRGAV